MDNQLISELEHLIMILLIEQMWMEWVSVVVTTFVTVCNAAAHYIDTVSSDDDSANNVWVDNDRVRVTHLDRLLHCDDTTCIEQLRMNRENFFKLCELLRTEGKLTSNMIVSIEEQVAMFLYILGHHKKNRIVKFDFIRSGETISRNFNKVLNAVIRCSDSLLRAADPIGENCVDPRWKWFKNCLGALDGTHIKVKVPARDKTRYQNQKGEISTNVLGVCARDMQIIFVLSGWEGSTTDSKVLHDAVSRPNGFKVPVGYYYLVDGGYTNEPGFLAPYKGIKYHLQEWQNGHTPTNAKELFNMHHAEARNVIERTFSLLKIRWAILRSPSYYPIKTHNKIIIACALLHNFIRRTSPADPFEHLLDESTQHEDLEEADHIEVVETDQAWTAWRDDLANEMWQEWINNRQQV